MVWKCDSAGYSEDRPGNGPEKRPRRNESDEIPETGFKERESADGSRLSLTSTKRKFRKGRRVHWQKQQTAWIGTLLLGEQTQRGHMRPGAMFWSCTGQNCGMTHSVNSESTSCRVKCRLCHCRKGQAYHANNSVRLSITMQPRTERTTAHLRRGKLCWSEGRQDRVDSEESDVEQVEPNAPSGQGGRGKPMAIGSGDVERLFCDGQGLCSPGLWVPEDRVHPSAPAWLELSRLFLYTTETLGTIQACVRACIGRSPAPAAGDRRSSSKEAWSSWSEKNKTGPSFRLTSVSWVLCCRRAGDPRSHFVFACEGEDAAVPEALHQKKRRRRTPEQPAQVEVDDE